MIVGDRLVREGRERVGLEHLVLGTPDLHDLLRVVAGETELAAVVELNARARDARSGHEIAVVRVANLCVVERVEIEEPHHGLQ
jgi:MinD-like ATPase involved in chromosome partitioning or flagellar assembly